MRDYDFDHMVVDGKKYLPPNGAVFAPGDTASSIVLGESFSQISSRVHQTVLVPSTFKCRRLGRASARFSFEGGAAASGVMVRHIQNLYQSQRPFWIEADSIFARDFAVCQAGDASGLRWITPTFPIAPKASDPGETFVWTGCVYVNGKKRDSGWTIDAAEGLVEFSEGEDISIHSRVQLLYRWRMPAVITAMSQEPHTVGGSAAVARTAYTLMFLVEQWKGALPAWEAPTFAEEYDPEEYDI